MVRRSLSKVLCLVILVNCFIGVSFTTVLAEDAVAVSISYSSILELFRQLETKLSSLSSQDKTQIYTIGKTYIETNVGIDALINLVNNPTSMEAGIISNIISELSAKKNELLFILNFIKSIDEESRKAKLALLTSRYEFLNLTDKQKTALSEIYSKFFSADFITMLQEKHHVNDRVILSLISCIDGTFILTDSKTNTNKLAIESIDSNFAVRLSGNMAMYFSAVNDISTNSGENILKAIINTINASEDSAMISNYKLVFDALGMYVKYDAPSSGNSGSSSTGGSGSITYINPIFNKPQVIPTPQVAAEKIEEVVKFSDVKSHWSTPYVSEMVSRKVFTGYVDGQFKPEQGITREEVAVALVRALDLEAKLESIQDSSFIDESDMGDWSKKSVALLVEMKILNGYDDGSFKPKNLISREELSAIIARSVTKTASNVQITFGDKDTIKNWAQTSINKVYALGIVKGYEDNTFKPNKTVTRAEVVTILYNFMFTENLL